MKLYKEMNMKKLVFLLALPLMLSFKAGSGIDEKKMNRDLEVAKNILATLIKGDSNSFFGGESIDASYIPNYGVVFTIPEHMVFFKGGANTFIAVPDVPEMPDMDFNFDFDIDTDADTDIDVQKKEIIIRKMENAREQSEKAREEAKKARKEAEKARKEMEKKNEKIVEKHVYVGSGAHPDVDWKQVMTDFITDYADLIGQLLPSDKIVIKQKSPFEELVVIGYADNDEERAHKGSLSAEVLRKDISDFKTGKLSKEELINSIKFEQTLAQKKVADLEMFAGIFDRFFSPDLTESYFVNSKPRYEVLDGFGVVFHIKANTNRTVFVMAGKGTGQASWTATSNGTANDKEDIKIRYQKFKDAVQDFLLDYGRTIRSLNDGDLVRLEISIKGCDACGLPKMLQVSAPMSALKKYDQQKITRQKALGMIKVKES